MMIAGHTGWSEDWILWALPFTRALQYRHYILRASGEWTVRPDGTSSRSQSDLQAEFAALRSRAQIYRARGGDDSEEE
jgi:hypothetical protein